MPSGVEIGEEQELPVQMRLDERDNLGVFIGGFGHHVAPVAPHRFQVEQYEFVFSRGLFEQRGGPALPPNRGRLGSGEQRYRQQEERFDFESHTDTTRRDG